VDLNHPRCHSSRYLFIKNQSLHFVGVAKVKPFFLLAKFIFKNLKTHPAKTQQPNYFKNRPVLLGLQR
jgi:hypothetical protein